MRILPRRNFSLIFRSRARHYSHFLDLNEVPAPPNDRKPQLAAKPVSQRQDIIFSGIQPTGVPHLGNYLGALREWKDLQDNAKLVTEEQPKLRNLFFSVVDLHALTGRQSHEERRELRKDTFVSLLAIGIDPKISHIFYQSQVAAHSELMWILSTLASTGYLSRMTQWKSKLELPNEATLSSDEATERLKLGLFSYPVLQAADVLVHRATLVPVGEDQSQHIEFARSLARSFNAHYAEGRSVLKEPKALISPAKRIMSLREPSKKMSKSHADPKSRILITDDEETIQAKFKVALTDNEDGISFEPIKRPGISNLLTILKHVTRSEDSCEEIAREHASMSKGAFKGLVADEVIRAFTGFRDRFEEISQPRNKLYQEALERGKQFSRASATSTLSRVHSEMGLIRPNQSIQRSSKSAGREA